MFPRFVKPGGATAEAEKAEASDEEEEEGEADEADGGDVDMLLPPPPLLLPPTFFFPPPPLPMPFLPPLGIEERACLALRDNEHRKRG